MGISYSHEPHPPAWGPPTSRANFCEEDYIVTGWIGEFVNTLSNMTYVYFAARGLYRLKQTGTSSQFANLQYYGLAFVGVASMWFHCFLKFYSQMADDLSMLVAAGTVFHRVLTFDKSIQTQTRVGLAIATFLSIFSAWHIITDEIYGHQIVFGIMVDVVAYKTYRILTTSAKPSERSQLKRLAILGAVSFLSGYGLWNVDFVACDWLNSSRRALGMPWGFLLELHSWWHVLTAIGVYVFMALVEYLTEPSGNKEGFAWPASIYLRGHAKK